MGKVLINGVERAKRFYIEQLVKTGNYQPQELFTQNLSDLTQLYQKEVKLKVKQNV